MFVDWAAGAHAPLAPAGRITIPGLFSVSAFNARNALAEIYGVDVPSSLGEDWAQRLPWTDVSTGDEIGLPAHSLFSDPAFLAGGPSSTPSRKKGVIAVVVVLILAAVLLLVAF